VQQLLAAGPAGASHADCLAVHKLLAEQLQLPGEAAEWQQQCAAAFPWSRAFGGPDCVSVAAPWEEEEAKKASAGVDEATVNGVEQQTAQLAI
jgi:hypothetical protein